MGSNAVLKSLASISKGYPSIIESSTLPLLFHTLPDASPPISDNVSRDKYRSILHSLSELCVLPALFETLVVRILNKLETVSLVPITNAEQRECEIAYSYDLLDCLYGVIGQKIEGKHMDITKHFDTIIPRLTTLAVQGSMAKIGAPAGSSIWGDKRLLGLLGRVIDRLNWELPVESVIPSQLRVKQDADSISRQAKYLESVHAAFDKGEITRISSGDLQMSPGSPLRVSLIVAYMVTDTDISGRREQE